MIALEEQLYIVNNSKLKDGGSDRLYDGSLETVLCQTPAAAVDILSKAVEVSPEFYI